MSGRTDYSGLFKHLLRWIMYSSPGCYPGCRGLLCRRNHSLVLLCRTLQPFHSPACWTPCCLCCLVLPGCSDLRSWRGRRIGQPGRSPSPAADERSDQEQPLAAGWFRERGACLRWQVSTLLKNKKKSGRGAHQEVEEGEVGGCSTLHSAVLLLKRLQCFHCLETQTVSCQTRGYTARRLQSDAAIRVMQHIIFNTICCHVSILSKRVMLSGAFIYLNITFCTCEAHKYKKRFI